MNDNETITFNKKEVKMIMSYLDTNIEFVMLPALENKDWNFKRKFNEEEQFTFLNKIRKMCVP